MASQTPGWAALKSNDSSQSTVTHRPRRDSCGCYMNQKMIAHGNWSKAHWCFDIFCKGWAPRCFRLRRLQKTCERACKRTCIFLRCMCTAQGRNLAGGSIFSSALYLSSVQNLYEITTWCDWNARLPCKKKSAHSKDCVRFGGSKVRLSSSLESSSHTGLLPYFVKCFAEKHC